MSDKVLMLNTDSFDAAIGADKPVLVDFWAEWCGPCRMLTPVIEELAGDMEGKADVCKLNVDESPEIAQRYGVFTIPTVIVFKNGEIVEKSVGFRQKAQLAELIEKAL